MDDKNKEGEKDELMYAKRELKGWLDEAVYVIYSLASFRVGSL